MPVDKSKPQKSTAKRPQEPVHAEYIAANVPGANGLTHARELEVKRSRGEVSCAECRRLKIKCDKQIPCQSCVRRGCSALCPNGALATGQGTRFVLAATEHLHRKIARMGERIRLLEDALTTLHASKGGADGGAHPLLLDGEDFSLGADDIAVAGSSGPSGSGRRMSGTWEVEAGPDGSKVTVAGAPGGDVIDAFGTLSISDHGISRFFGPTGGSESLLLANIPDTPSSSSASASASPSSLSLSRSSQSLSPASTHASAPDSPARNTGPSPSSGNYSPHHVSPSSRGSYSGSTSESPLTLFSPASFPLTPLGPPQAIHALIASHLPARAHAKTLVESYFSQLAWLFRGVTRGQVGDMMRGVYAAYGSSPRSRRSMGNYAGGDEADGLDEDEKEVDDMEADGEDEDYTGPHDLALLFMVFAVGALVQPGPSTSPTLAPTVPSSHPHSNVRTTTDDAADAHRRHIAAEAEHLHQIARVALALQPVLEKPSLVTIQALHLLSIYTSMAAAPGSGTHSHRGQRGGEANIKGDRDDSGETSMEMTWSLITLAAHLSQTIGLHRDSARWGLSAKMVQRRRILFWDLFVADVWTSLNTGRPPSFSLAYIDCSFPTYETSGPKARDGVFEVWQFRFAAECVAEVTARTLTAEAPSYATIMELDRKVREFPLPPLEDPSVEDVGASLQRCVLEHIRETVLMYIHRSFFAQAIIEQPLNPLKSTYAPSFLAAYRASATILKSVREQFAVMPNACARFWTMWTFAFSAAVVFGTVVTRGPRSPLAAAAMTELEQACVLFSKAAVYNRRATKALPILTKLSEKARHALAAAQNDPSGAENGVLWNMTGVLGPSGLPVKVKNEEPDDELSIFAGHTRFVSGQVQRGIESSSILPFPAQPPPPHQQPNPSQVHVPQSHQRSLGQMQGREEMPHGSYEAPVQRRYPAAYPPQQQTPPRQRMHSMPSSSYQPPHMPHLEARPTPTVNVDVNLNWDSRDYPQSAQDYVQPPLSAMDERMHHHPHHPQPHQFYTPEGSRMPQTLPPPPSAPYAWPVDTYEPPPQHRHHQQQPHYQPHPHQQQQQQPHQQVQQQQYAQGMYADPQHAAAYQAHNAELAQLGLASRDSRLDERWSTFMEDSGLLEGIEFRAR
ncbi:fungal-specific transcription factor domain-containing protein [Mycena metata]|uniref:Fungal-specific transcription factor domain-containing protein n=1 Tax=Mycena metata TaxID=1033252 RepID=A0AAD7NWX1_9AGAR|nr:fungal-specific transcription factor domain-containing protein [Mycena metata]